MQVIQEDSNKTAVETEFATEDKVDEIVKKVTIIVKDCMPLKTSAM